MKKYSAFYLRIRKGVQVNGAPDEAALFAGEILTLQARVRKLRRALREITVAAYQRNCVEIAEKSLSRRSAK